MDKIKHLKNYKLATGFLFIIVVVLFILNEVAGAVGLILVGIILYEIIYQRDKFEEEKIDHIEKLSQDFDSAAQDSLFNMPFPLILTSENGKIKWYNPSLLKLIDEKQAVGSHIEDVISNFSFQEMTTDLKKKKEININNKNHLVYVNKIAKADSSSMFLFYFVENTEFDKLKKNYLDTRIGFGHIYVDNFDEIGLGQKRYIKSLISSEVENKVLKYFNEKGGVVRRYEDDKYLLVFNRVSLNAMIEDRFSILDAVREIGKNNSTTVTLSIGISETLDNISESFEESRDAVDLALGRGGDQVVMRTNNGHEFFGGRTQAREKRNRVRARVIGNSLGNLIEEASEVFIMGHKNADMDAIGSAIGMLGAVRRKNKDGFIVLNEVNPSIKLIMDYVLANEPEIKDYIISSEKAIENAQKTESLIICLDNHKKYLAEEPRLFDMIDNVVIIDHHRKGNDAIENPVLSYIESYASSTSELITEILEYMDPDMNISKIEAEAMLSGIIVDTKNFTFQTGVRTFEAASILRRQGADPTEVSKLFNDDLETVRLRAKLIHDADIIRNEIAIAKFEENVNSNILIAAQTADSLLKIVGVNASFVLTQTENAIHISGRSTGEISVQLILEKIGGGGHLVSAATRIENVSIEKAYNMLLGAIDKYYEEIESEEKLNEDNIIEG